MGQSTPVNCCLQADVLKVLQQAANNSGYVGAAIVGVFAMVVACWYGIRWGMSRMKRRDLVDNK